MEKHYDFELIEKQMQTLWREMRAYAFKSDHTKPLYSIDTPPPTVNGSLHIGHIFSYTQAEMIARYRRMQGYNVFYPFGFDDNGLPTERLVEKELGIRAGQMPRSAFIEACLETTKKYETEFKALWSSLGFSCDWSLQYETISPDSQRISQRSFIELYEKGKAYVKESPVLWCTECQTSIAQAELDTLEKETIFYTLKFDLVDDLQVPVERFEPEHTSQTNAQQPKPQTLLVATTRPELLNGCVALFVHPEDDRYKGLIGKSANVPLYNYQIPILGEATVDREKGTGIVMVATFGDATDVTWVQSHGLPYRSVITADGTIEADDPILGSLKVGKARAVIVEQLRLSGLIEGEQTINHIVGTHERCGKPTEIIPSRQWYIDILTDQARFIEAADAINWYPEHMKNRYLNWVQNLKWDWCISRQRFFGVPIPVWYCAACGKAKIAEALQLPVNPLETAPIGACSCGHTVFIPESAVLDTWATSSITPQINGKWGEADDWTSELMPMSMRTQAHEIIRTWAFYSIVKSLYHTGEIPWKDLMICGFVLAKKGEKISKSKSNAVQSPTELIKTHSADVMRYWAANAKLGTDTFFDAEELSIAKRFINKLWHASKFCFSQLENYVTNDTSSDMANRSASSQKTSHPEIYLPIDLWILERLQDTFNLATAALDVYEIGTARHYIDTFFFSDFCDDYLELVKERLYQPEKHGYDAQKSGQAALYQCLLGLLKLYAPYVPHITEYLYQSYFASRESTDSNDHAASQSKFTASIHLTTWPKSRSLDETLMAFGKEIKAIIGEARRYKSENKLSMKAEMPTLTLQCSQATQPLYAQSLGDLKACTHAIEFIMSEND
jgi:valyl-tRNA synthetase